MWSRHLAASTVRWLSRAAPALACAAVAATAPSCDRAFATGTLDHEPDASATPTRRSPALPAPLHASNVSGSDKYPVFTAEDVALRDGSGSAPGGQMWVSIGRGVYDVTAFVHEHPGGARLLKDAVGGPVEGMWAYWAYHYVRCLGIVERATAAVTLTPRLGRASTLPRFPAFCASCGSAHSVMMITVMKGPWGRSVMT